MVALLMLWGTAACTNEVPVNPDITQVVTLKNLLPDAKPGYSHADSRTTTSLDWVDKDELLMEITIDGDSKDYTICAKLICDGTNWTVQNGQSFTTDGLDLLVVPEDGFALNGDNAGLKVVIPNEIENATVTTAFYYAPDLQWSAVGTMEMESNPSTTAPEYWTLTDEGSWTTSLARVGVKTAASTQVTLSGVTAHSINGGSENSFTVTGTDGMAYFYVNPISNVSSGFTVKQGSDVLFEASAMNVVTLAAGESYLIDATIN